LGERQFITSAIARAISFLKSVKLPVIDNAPAIPFFSPERVIVGIHRHDTHV
jgi:hypothetical protein